MPMELKQVSAVLEQASLREPVINVLIPDTNNYRVLLLQPQGVIKVDSHGVRNRDHILADKQFGQLLQDAIDCQADLVITPEYSMPWKTLIKAIEDRTVPEVGKLWVLGCESTTYADLQQLKQDLRPYAEVIFETLDPDPERFVDPLAYVFKTQALDGSERVVVLVQFKTTYMGDSGLYEVKALQLGKTVYQFGGLTNASLKLFTLICSDAFAVQDSHALQMYDRALVIHVQLNPKPRQRHFRSYRQRLMQYKGDATEIICLNWAKNVVEWTGGGQKVWDNIGGSAWYLRPSDYLKNADETLMQDNHQRGLYYTWFGDLRVHALFFNYLPATFLLTATKVEHVGVLAPLSRRRGPELIRTCVWKPETESWVEQLTADDGFAALVTTTGVSPGAKNAIIALSGQSASSVERVLALAAGEIGSEDWYSVTQLDSFGLTDAEEIRRVTFCQDQVMHSFRVSRLRCTGILWDLLRVDSNLPAALKDLEDGFQFTWTESFRHQNVVSEHGQRATVIYLGEHKSHEQIEAIAKRVDDFLLRAFASDLDVAHNARQRLAVWYRDAEGDLSLYDPNPHQTFDETGEESPIDIGREE